MWRRSSLPFGFWWWVVFVVSIVLRVWQFATARLWYDEINTLWWASLPFDRMVAATAGDVHPPFYYAMVWLVIHLAPTLWPVMAVRLPSLVLSIVAMPLMLAVGRSLKLSDAAILGGTIIMSLATMQLFYAQEGRMYALLQVEVLIALWALLNRRWVSFTVASAAMLWTHNYGLIYLAVFFVFGVAREYLKSRTLQSVVPVIGSTWLAFVFYSPWVFVLSAQMSAVKSTWWTSSTTLGAAIAPFYQHVFYSGLVGVFDPMGQIVMFGLAAFAIVRAVLNWRYPTGLTLTFFALTPMLLAWSAELVYRPIYLQRALIGTAVPLYLLIAWAITEHVPTVKRFFAWGVLVPLLVVSVLFFYPASRVFKGEGYGGAAVVATIAQPGDVIYHLNPGTIVQFHLDYARADTPQYLAPNSAGSLGTLTPATLQAMGITQLPFDELPRWQRLFLVWNAGPMTASTEDAAVQTILARYPHTQLDENKIPWATSLVDGGVWLLTKETNR
jgi:uncharacterized membrane protein